MRNYTSNEFKQLFQSQFDINSWVSVLKDFFRADELRQKAEYISDTEGNDKGFYLGALNTTDSYRIGLFYYEICQSNVARKKVGLRNLVRSFINPNWGQFDAALAVFSDGTHWRLSLISDIKGEKTSPKRYTFVFGETGNLYRTAVERFMMLQSKGISFDSLKEAFSVEALTKQFYNDLFEWYQWAVSPESNVTFPNDTTIEDDDRENIDTKIIRLITRIMFVWFIKQKGLVPNNIFDENYLQNVLSDFEPQSETEGNYYNAILQNLFFATLNRAIQDEQGNGRRFSTLKDKRDIKNLYRYAELFSISEDKVIEMFSHVPFLNGGLFECQDKTVALNGVEKAYNYDGFSRNDSRFADGRFKYRATIPNCLFFRQEYGLFDILNRYNFTIEENSPNEQQVALDPELLGKVFENLLGAYNPETQETARNQSGSFYTPREIVNYMVDESLKAYLGDTELVNALLDDSFVTDEKKRDEYNALAKKIKAIRILDPACGSGAFPMGLLNRMVDILQKISPEENIYDLKLSIIENCIYGSDIQSIAAQISKLRFFISLICDCNPDKNQPNFGIPTLPNLETKFVCADSLIALKKKADQRNLFEDPQIAITQDELRKIRHDHFSARTSNAKKTLRLKDEEARKRLAVLLEDNGDFAPEDAHQMVAWNPYDQNACSPFFDPEWMFGVKDFDIVIGNPPYIQLQNNGGELAEKYEDGGYATFARTGDIYCLFYERGWQLLKEGGHLCFITSNKWMRAGYGEKTRDFFAKKTNPQLLVDFAGVKIFESATVDTNILLFARSTNKKKTICAVTNKRNKDSIKELSDFVKQQNTICSFSTSDSWVILSPIEQSIKQKIEAVGTPLKDWDIQINYGIKTGFNDAFIISTDKRNEILANCQSEDERKRTADLIRPILRGRDIKRYSYDWADLWLINTHNGVRGIKDRIHIEDYPAVKTHLDQYWNKISRRADKGDTPYNLRNCAYLDDFNKPKILYPDIAQRLSFVLDTNKYVLGNTAYFMAADKIELLDSITHILNSSLIDWYYRTLSVQLGAQAVRMFSIYVLNIPIPKSIEIEQFTEIEGDNLDCKVFTLYGLNEKEIEFIVSL